MAAHALHNQAAKGLVNACGLCLSMGQVCVFYLKKPKGTGRAYSVGTEKSRCPNMSLIKLGAASKSLKANPCTNVLIICPVCLKDFPAVWKYNLENHLMCMHQDQNVEDYASLFSITGLEKSSLKKMYKAV